MKLLQKFIVVFLCAVITFAPVLVEARAGSSRSGSSHSAPSHQSMGSRGSKTHESNGAKPIERSMTQKSAPAPQTPPKQVSPAPTAPVAPPAMAQPSFFQRHPFISGIAGGLVGSWIGSMLFNNHSRGEAGTRDGNDWDAGASPAGRTLGSMLPFLLIAGLIMLGIWFYRRNAAAQSFAGYGSGPVPMRSDNEAWNSYIN